MLKLPSLAFELTPRCNQQCVYCYNVWRNDPPDAAAELSTSEVCQIVDRIVAEAELTRITLTGGEPFMRDDLFQIVEHINRHSLPVAVISNGGLIDKAAARRLAALNVSYVQVTLAGPDGDTHDAVCGRGSFDSTTRGVAVLAAAEVAVGGSFLCSRQNFASAGDTFQRMFDIGIGHHFAFNRFNPSGCAVSHADELLPTRSDVLVALEQADRFAESKQLDVRCTMPIPRCMVDEGDYPHIRFGQCAAGTDQGEYAIDPQGRLKLCTLQQQTIGSLLDTSLADLIADERVVRFRAMTAPFCEPCPHKEGCLGGCGAAAEWVFGRADELDPFLAQHVTMPVAARVVGDEDFTPRIDRWYDLVYHVLSYLPLTGSDASNLFDEAYIAWCQRQLAEYVPHEGHVPRTVVMDASLIATLYAASPRGHLLHAWPLLYDGVDDFRGKIATDFGNMTWTTGERERLAASIRGNTHATLPDLFQTALWSELVNGYEAYWNDQVLPRSERYREVYCRRLSQLARDLPGLANADWVLSHPLRIHGRLLQPSSARPVIVVGVADEELGVTESQPVLQGCHEYFVWKVQSAVSGGEAYSSDVGQPGYEAFRMVENAALTLGARFFVGSRWETPYREWLGRLEPARPPAETAARLAAGDTLSPAIAAAIADVEV